MKCKECANCELYQRQKKFEEMKTNGEIFYQDCRPFTKEEAKQYEDSLNKLFKPIGKNIFDLDQR
jgi:hypothetical protein